ncbi:hypothetical protein [Aureispira anguillae]|uniref:Lipoprotein n=1 Tax=Aureispira anguillae TaxID=2864201 RepID=A0A916DU54_9BACT|nr:hypothetical protein [Aureispira anguillae]BDS12265.1 hypothetical protein AsAng_0029840 [Aureispira anguillae]
MNKILIIAALVFMSYIWIACEKPPIYDDTPHITWNSFSADTVQQLTGSVSFKFDFTDGDGDLGKTGDTANHIIIVDTRRTPNDTAFYKIPTIEQQGIVSGISGQLEVTMSQICGIDPNNPLILCQEQPNYFDPIVYKIRIKDNAGRWSNEIDTDTLFVRCFIQP